MPWHVQIKKKIYHHLAVYSILTVVPLKCDLSSNILLDLPKTGGALGGRTKKKR